MQQKPWKNIILWVVICEAVGIIAGILTRQGTELYASTAIKPPLSPPGWAFPVVWTILYALMGVSAGIISGKDASVSRARGLNLMVMQLVVNFFWPLLFFNAQAYGFALIWLLILWIFVFRMIMTFYKVDKTAALLQLPYLLWLTFALYLNAAVWYLNR